MKVKYQKHYLIHKVLKYYQLVLIMWLKYGMSKVDKFYSQCKDIKIRYFHANSITKVIQL